MSQRPTLSRRGHGAMRAAALVSLMLLAALPAGAQSPTNSLGGFSQNSDEPIDIESDVLVVHDAKKYATFKGSVKAVQGKTTLKAHELDVHYSGSAGSGISQAAAPATPDAGAVASADPKPAGGAGIGGSGNQISKIEARGDVIIVTDEDQTTTSEWALYDVPTQMITVGGNVVLMQGKNVLKGDRLIIDLKTGESRFENQGNTAAGGRIRALFMPKQDAKSGDDKTDNDKTGKDKADDKGASNDKPEAATPAMPALPATPPSDSEALPLVPVQR